jgi:glycosyltransferase involved in cell wall biosynthesis
MMMNELSVLVPAFNEVDSLKVIIPELIAVTKKNNWQLIIIDDGSTDGTSDYIKNNFRDQLLLLRHDSNKGYGAALKKGIENASSQYLVNFDADGQHKVEDIEILFSKIKTESLDLVVGKREGEHHSTSYKTVGKKIIRTFISFAFRKNIPVHDINSGFKIFNKQKAFTIIAQCPDSMAFSESITILFAYAGFKISETPVSAFRRLRGKSKVNTAAAFRSFFDIFKLSLKQNPVFVILNLSLILALLILAVYIPLLLL